MASVQILTLCQFVCRRQSALKVGWLTSLTVMAKAEIAMPEVSPEPEALVASDTTPGIAFRGFLHLWGVQIALLW